MSADIDLALMFGAASIAILGIWRAVHPGHAIAAVTELAATILATMVVGAMLIIGDWSDWPEIGAWLAGAAVAVLGSAAVVSHNPRRLTVTLTLCLSITAVAACAVAVPPTHLTNSDPIHVIP